MSFECLRLAMKYGCTVLTGFEKKTEESEIQKIIITCINSHFHSVTKMKMIIIKDKFCVSVHNCDKTVEKITFKTNYEELSGYV